MCHQGTHLPVFDKAVPLRQLRRMSLPSVDLHDPGVDVEGAIVLLPHRRQPTPAEHYATHQQRVQGMCQPHLGGASCA